MSWYSTIAASAAPLQRTSWRTVTNTNGPVRPTLLTTSSTVDVRTTSSPTRTGERNSNRPPEAAAPGVAVRADLGLPVHRQEIQPVPQRRQRCAGRYRPYRVVQCGG